MINSKAIKVLKTFKADELKQFGKFVKSPFHNHNKNISKLYLYLKRHHPSFESANEHVYNYLFPGKKYNGSTLRHLFADLYRLCEEFLAHCSLKSDNFGRKSYILKKLNEKKLDDLFLLNVKKLNTELEGTKIGYDCIRNKWELENEMIKFLLMRDKQHKISYNVLKRSEYFVGFILTLIDLQTTDLNVQRYSYSNIKEPGVYDAFLNCINLKGLSKWLSENMSDRFVYLAIHCNLLMIWQYPKDESLFYKTKKLVLDNFQILEDSEKQNLIDALINYCNYNLKYIRSKEFIREEFELNKISISLLAKSKFKLRNIEFYNILSRAFELKELDWAEYFIRNYIKYVDDKGNIINYALSALHFEKCKFEESLEFINKLKPEDPYLKLQLKVLTLKLFYELDLIEPAYSFIESLRHFNVNTKEIGDSYKKSILNKIKIFNMLFDLKTNPERINEFSLEGLKRIINESSITGRRWYLEKAEDLEDKLR